MPLDIGGFEVADAPGDGVITLPAAPGVAGEAAGVVGVLGADGEVLIGCSDVAGPGTVVPDVVVGSWGCVALSAQAPIRRLVPQAKATM